MKDENPTAKFKELLSRFMEKRLLSDESVGMAYNYLFLKGALPFFTLTELYETVIYLKDVMNTNHLATLDDVFAYYLQKKMAVRAFIDTIRLDEPKGPQYIPDALPEDWIKPVDEEEPAQPLTPDEGDDFPFSINSPKYLVPMAIDSACVCLAPWAPGKKPPVENGNACEN